MVPLKLLSINVAVPAEVVADGRTVKTSIFKKPVPGPVQVLAQNLEGDEQSDRRVHGGPYKSVYVYSSRNIEYWRDYLKRPDLGPGSFGENLTVNGLTDTEVAVGDEFEIGTARFIVTQPRIPCFKLGIAIGSPDFPKVFHWAGRNGFYLRVLRQGHIESGDDIRMFPTREPRMTIAELVVLSNAKDLTPQQLDRILALEGLTPSWKTDFLERSRRDIPSQK